LSLKSKIRKDKFGNKIVNGNKNHKISFDCKANKIIEVENWKKYNYLDNYEQQSIILLARFMDE